MTNGVEPDETSAERLRDLGRAYRDEGHLAEAVESFQQSLAIYRALGDRHGESAVLDDLGNTYHELGTTFPPTWKPSRRRSTASSRA